MDDDEVLDARIALGRRDAEISLIFKRLFAFSGSLQGSDLAACENDAAEITRSLTMYESEFRRAQMAVDTLESEIHFFREERERLGGLVEKTGEEVGHIRNQLTDAQKRRIHLEEYEQLGHLIKEHPQRSDSESNISLLKQQCEALASEKASLITLLELRQKQFALLLNALEDLSTDESIGDLSTASSEVQRADVEMSA